MNTKQIREKKNQYLHIMQQIEMLRYYFNDFETFVFE
jgi:hypothetical protein